MSSGGISQFSLPDESRSDGLERLAVPSYRPEMEPFSPMRYDTLCGSIQSVSSAGKSLRKVRSFNPHPKAAFSSKGSGVSPLIRIHLNALPVGMHTVRSSYISGAAVFLFQSSTDGSKTATATADGRHDIPV